MTSNHENRVPPRFVPTLTEVVEVPEGLLPLSPPLPVPVSEAVLPQEDVEQGAPERQQDRPGHTAAWPSEALAPPPLPGASAVPASMVAWAEHITQRVMAHLEPRLSELLVAQSAELAHRLAQSVALQLGDELPGVVQQVIRECPSPSEIPSVGDQ